MLRTGNKYRIGDEIYTVTIEEAVESCHEQCDIKDCTANKEFKEFLKNCGCKMCIQLLGIGRCFKKNNP